jgi:hypothetical protein
MSFNRRCEPQRLGDQRGNGEDLAAGTAPYTTTNRLKPDFCIHAADIM